MIFDLGLPIKEKKLKWIFMNWNEFKWIKEKNWNEPCLNMTKLDQNYTTATSADVRLFTMEVDTI